MIIQLLYKLLGKQFIKPGSFERDRLYHETDWTYIYENHAILNEALSQVYNKLTLLNKTIDTIKQSGMVMINYLYITCGGILYTCISHYDILNTLGIMSYALLFVGYLFGMIIYLSYYFIVPPDKYSSYYLEPIDYLPRYDAPQNFLSLEIEKLLVLQGACDNNRFFSEKLRRVLSVSIGEIAVLITVPLVIKTIFYLL